MALRREPEVCAAWGGGEGYSWRSPWSKAREPNKLCGHLQAGDASRTKCALQIREPGFRPVVETYVRETDTLIHLTYKREARSSRRSEEKGGNADDGDGPATLIGTAEHPFWSLTRNQWVNMGELAAGERLRLDNGSAIVTGVKEKVLAAPVKVYNF